MDLFIKNESFTGGAKTKQQKYIYNIDNVVDKNLNSIPSDEINLIKICCYRVVTSNKYKKILFTFLQYMLFKYPKGASKFQDLCVFPFEKYAGKKNISKIGEKKIKDIFNKKADFKGYIHKNKNIYLFYEIPYKNLSLNLQRSHQLWWATISEICNNKNN